MRWIPITERLPPRQPASPMPEVVVLTAAGMVTTLYAQQNEWTDLEAHNRAYDDTTAPDLPTHWLDFEGAIPSAAQRRMVLETVAAWREAGVTLEEGLLRPHGDLP